MSYFLITIFSARIFHKCESEIVPGGQFPILRNYFRAMTCINGVDTLIRLFVFESSSLMACLGKSSDSFWWSESNFFVEVPCRIRSKTSASSRRLRCSNFTSSCCLCSLWFAFSSSTICVSFPLVPFVVMGDWN